MSDRQLERYIEKADKLLVERRQRKWGRMRALHLARREAMDARALQAADYRTALVVLQDMAKLQELYMDERELRKVQRELKELEARMKPLLRTKEGDDPLADYLDGLPVGDRVRLDEQLRGRGYDVGPLDGGPPRHALPVASESGVG